MGGLVSKDVEIWEDLDLTMPLIQLQPGNDY